MMDIEFILEQDTQKIILPIPPPNFQWARDGKNETVEVVGIGDILIPGGYGLATAAIESFFPADSEVKPHEYKDMIVKMWGQKTPILFTITNMNQNSLLTIN